MRIKRLVVSTRKQERVETLYVALGDLGLVTGQVNTEAGVSPRF